MSQLGALHRRNALYRPSRLVLSFVAIALGSGLAVAIPSTFASITQSVRRVATVSVRTDLLVAATTAAGVDEALVDEASKVRGVDAVAPVLAGRVRVNGQDAILFGVDDRLSGLAGPFRSCLRLTGDFDPSGMIAGPAIGSRRAASARVAPDAGAVGTGVPIVGVASCERARRLNGGRFVVASLRRSQRLLGRDGRIDVVLVSVAHEASVARVKRQLVGAIGGRAIAGTTQEVARRLTPPLLRSLEQLYLLLATLTVIVAGLIVFNTTSMTALERRREVATLRTLGGFGRRLMRGFLAEAAAVGVAGSLAGLVAGAVLTRWIVSHLPALVLGDVQPVATVPIGALVLGSTVGVGVSVAGAYLPARHVVRVEPIEAMRPEGVLEEGLGSGNRPVVALAGLAVFAAAALAAPHVDGDGLAAVVGAMQLSAVAATFGGAGALAKLGGRAVAWLGASGRLAAASVERAPRRAWATIAAVAAAVGIVVVSFGVSVNQLSTHASQFGSLARTDLLVQTAPITDLPVRRTLDRRFLARVATLPAVSKVVPGQVAYLTSPDEQLIVEAFGGPSEIPLFARASRPARDAVIANSAAIVNRHYAQRHHVRRGSPLVIHTPAGPRSLPIADVVDVLAYGDGLVGVPFGWFASHFGRAGSTWVEVELGPGADAEAVKSQVAALGGGRGAGVYVATGEEVLAAGRRAIRESARLFEGADAVIVVGAGLAIFNTLLFSVVQRRRELAVLRAIGTTTRQLRLMVLGEAAALAAIGVTLGFAMGELGHVVALRLVEGALGVSIAYQLTLAPFAVAAVAAAASVTMGALAPAWWLGRLKIVEAIGYD